MIVAKFAGVIVDVHAKEVDRIFHYQIPEKLANLQIGHRVLVPFGPRKIEGYVIELTDRVDFPESKLRKIIRILDPEPLLTQEQINVAKWMAERYLGPLSQALQLFLPVGIRYGKERVSEKQQLVVKLVNPDRIDTYLQELPKNAHLQYSVLLFLKEQPSFLASELCRLSGANHSTLRALEKKGYLTIEQVVIKRTLDIAIEQRPVPTLNSDQQKAVNKIIEEFHTSKQPILLHGVTGSGKTEVYLRAIDYCLSQGRQAIMMVPEIALTAQTIAWFTQRFPNQIAILHSGLSEGERFDQWNSIYSGEVGIVVGARSAVFAPLKNIGLIILDEEHENTYKQEDGSLKYHAREVALKRAQEHDALVILGSATPALESYHQALQGNYCLVEMPHRVAKRPLPSIQLIDMREEFNQGNRTIFSRELTNRLNETLAAGEQAIIFLNRRGFSSFVLCRKCGFVVECLNCQVSLTYHEPEGVLLCHYCNARHKMPDNCPNCASSYLRQFGVGTQQVEQFIRQNFPQAKTIRLDADTTRRKGAHQRILNSFKTRQTNVLIGTQMVAKGLDFPNVTLVGVLSADFLLNFPDFRAAERTFQLLTQVSGRAGRDVKPGNVVIQCYDPTHYGLQAVKKQDYINFYRQEITFRRQMAYPPYGYLIRILVQGSDQAARENALAIYHFLENNLADVELFQPAPAPISRIKGRHRWQILIKSKILVNDVLQQIQVTDENVRVSIDTNPLSLL